MNVLSVSTPDTGAPAPRSYVFDFAQLLKRARADAELSGRALAGRIKYSPTRVVRAEGGKELPNWMFTREYLGGCGIGRDVVLAWHGLWQIARGAERELRADQKPAEIRGWFWTMAEDDWAEGVVAINRPDPMLARLAHVTTAHDLGAEIRALADRQGAGSLRKVEAQTEIPKTTLHRWYTGRATPDAAQLSRLLTAFGAPQTIQRAFTLTLTRMSGGVCRGADIESESICTLGEFHRGPHRAKDGSEWLDDGDPDDYHPRDRPRLRQ
ncbi:helix-turn-helix transcriptional regulator [Streptomyces sp. SID13031]|uniref:helix-turn-helix domain-containing protein n=1 Tax=Streptomyces sp. SID13031 TaxID=2706046 RepID=UPI0013C915A8|nr:helix-turn-helix transcriptional regulator [Streptomyces sp. SID13031]NEA34269.1 helix-turn-helix domain-containing protein [Streptomyces sp. SID13031]